MPSTYLLADLFLVVCFAFGVFWIGGHLHKGLLNNSRLRRPLRHVPEWTAAGFLLAGMCGGIRNWPNSTHGMGTWLIAGTGASAGLCIGTVRGLMQYRQQHVQSGGDRESPAPHSRDSSDAETVSDAHEIR